MSRIKQANSLLGKAIWTLLIVSGLLCANASANVGGTVYRDVPVNGTNLNTYGVQDSNELGVEGVTVTVYPGGNTTTTASDGSWSISGITGDVRIEFTWSSLPWLKSSPDAGGTNTSVQFVTAPNASVNLGLHYPQDYSDTATPLVAVPRHENGQAAGNTDPALFSMSYDQNGNFGPDDGIPDDWTGNNDASFEEIGATWGIAYQKSKQRMFLSALVKRHSGMANGLDAIYVLDYSSTPVSSISHFNLQGVSGIDLGTLDRASGIDYTLPSGNASPSHDLDAFTKAGTVGFGDIDLSEDEKTLWAVNLNQKALIQVDVSSNSTPSTATQTLLSGLMGLPSCSGGELRPWALKLYQSKGYLGFVCDASDSQDPADLEAYVTSFDPDNLAGGLTQELNFSLNYPRSTNATHAPRTNHEPWMFTYDNNLVVDGSYAQALLSDIEFSPDGTMYLGFLDRWGIQVGHRNYPPISGVSWTFTARAHGELLKVCKINGNWALEGSDPACPTQNETSEASGVSNNGEFFNDHGGDDSREYTLGALAQLAGSGQLITAMNDPFPGLPADTQYWHNNGLQWYSLADGSHQTYVQTDATHGDCDYTLAASRACGFAKSSGIGDVELLTKPAPVEIGNLVWLDANDNGVQDADENGLPSVTVELVSGTSVIETATTDAEGRYIFSNDPNGTSTASHRYNISGLTADTNYTIRIPNITGASQQAVLSTYELTTNDSGEGSTPDINDSDGISSNDHAEATVLATSVPYSGANNHTFDFGFRNAPACSINQPTITTQCNDNGTSSNPNDDTFTYTINASASNASATYSISGDDIQNNLAYGVNHTSPSSFNIANGNLNLTLTDDITASCTLADVIVTAPATCSSATPQTDLQVTKMASSNTANSGDTITYTITVTNNGPNDATSVEITDQLPNGVTYSTHSASQGTYTQGNGIWDVGNLANGANATLTIDVTID